MARVRPNRSQPPQDDAAHRVLLHPLVGREWTRARFAVGPRRCLEMRAGVGTDGFNIEPPAQADANASLDTRYRVEGRRRRKDGD